MNNNTFTVKSTSRSAAVAYVRRNCAEGRKMRVVEVEDLGQSGNSRMWSVTVEFLD